MVDEKYITQAIQNYVDGLEKKLNDYKKSPNPEFKVIQMIEDAIKKGRSDIEQRTKTTK